jgi:hypothetical protein
MGKFFDTFPRTYYDLDGTRSGSYEIATNIFVRVGILNSLKNNSSVYYPYLIQDGDTPEMIADKYYGAPDYHWVVLYMNDIQNPYYDWPLDYKKFENYLIGKYGSVAASQSLVVRYEKTIVRTDSSSAISTTSKIIVDATTYAGTSGSSVTYNLSDGTTVTETISKNTVTAFQDEVDINERKRSIKLLKKEYIELINKNLQSIFRSSPAYAASVITPNVTT